MDDVLPGERARRRDRVHERDGPLEGDLLVDPDLLLQLPAQRLHEALAGVHAAAREQPVALVALLVAAQEYAVTPAQHGRDADAWLAGHAPRGAEAGHAPLRLGQLVDRRPARPGATGTRTS